MLLDPQLVPLARQIRQASLGNMPEFMSIAQAMRRMQDPKAGKDFALLSSGRAMELLGLQFCNLRYVPMMNLPFLLRGTNCSLA